MKIMTDGGYIEAGILANGKIWIAIGAEHYNPDGTRKETLINAVDLKQEEVVQLFSDIFPEENQVEEKSNTSSQVPE